MQNNGTDRFDDGNRGGGRARARRRRIAAGTVSATALLVAAALGSGLGTGLGCDSNNNGTVDYSYEDPYLYTYYYPADMAYSGLYAADSWNYGLYYSTRTGIPEGDATVITGSTIPSLGGTVRALIRGESVCDGQVTVTPKTVAAACTGSGVANVRNGITIVFNGCQLSGGGKIDGTFDVTAQRTASAQVCAADTTITLGYTTTLTNLAYTSPSGARIVIPSQSDAGNANYTFGQNAGATTVNTTGEVQFFNSAGTMIADQSYSGTRTLTLSTANQTYTIDGNLATQDKQVAGASATLVGSGILRSTGCCRPTGGTLTVTRTGGLRPGQHIWMFGSSCGAATLDGANVTLPACE